MDRFKITITEAVPGERSYPTAVSSSGERLTRKYGSWLVFREGGIVLEPECVGIDPYDLQAQPEVKAFDAQMRARAAQATTTRKEGNGT